MPVPRRRPKPLLVGESNPYGGDPYFALYPSPANSAGDRLCRLILRTDPDTYLERYDRVNLIPCGDWNLTAARERVKELTVEDIRRGLPRKYLLLGAKVCAAWAVPFKPFEVWCTGSVLILPHPSGRNGAWRDPEALGTAHRAVCRFLES